MTRSTRCGEAARAIGTRAQAAARISSFVIALRTVWVSIDR